YSTWKGERPRKESALEEFLLNSRAGHCEYFATATTLLLRAAGVPARYAVGFSVQEWSRLEQRYIVRARHAHSWTLAYVNGGWRGRAPGRGLRVLSDRGASARRRPRPPERRAALGLDRAHSRNRARPDPRPPQPLPLRPRRAKPNRASRTQSASRCMAARAEHD